MDLIERQAAIERIDEALSRVIKGPCGEKILARVPSAQPEIIRCRDCVWHDGNVCRNNESIPWSDDDFCSNAERREVSE